MSALMVWFSQGVKPFWFFAWIAPVPVLLLSFRSSASVAGLVTFAAWAAGRLSLTSFLAALQIPLPASAAIIVAPAASMAFVVLLSRALVVRGATLSGTLAFPAAWVSAEYLAASGPDGTWGALGYSQVDILPVLQLASLTGLCGVSFLLTFVAAGLAVGLHSRNRILLGTTGGILLAALGFGAWRLRSEVPNGSTARVGLAAIEQTRDGFLQVISGDPAGMTAILNAYIEQVDALAREGAAVVLLPEAIASVRHEDLAAVQAQLASTAARNRVSLVVGMRLVAEPKGRNLAMVFAPSGALLGTYAKHHLVTSLETRRLEPGTDLLVIDSPVRCGVEICKDMDFPALTQRYADANVALLLVPAWDFRVDGWLHSRMAIMRGVEHGLSVVRAAQDGVLTVSDAYGRVLAERVTGDAPARLIAAAPADRQATLYSRAGDWFAYLSFAILAFVVARLLHLVMKERSLRAATR